MGQGPCSRGRDSAAPAAFESDPPGKGRAADQRAPGSIGFKATLEDGAVLGCGKPHPRCGPGGGRLPRTNLVTSLLSPAACGADPLCVPAKLLGIPHSFAQTSALGEHGWSESTSRKPDACRGLRKTFQGRVAVSAPSGWQGSPGGLIPPPGRLSTLLTPGARMTVPRSGQEVTLRWECLREASVPRGEPSQDPQEAPVLRDTGPPWPRCGDCPPQLIVHAPPAILVLGSKEPQREDCNGEGCGQSCVCDAL